MKDKWFSFLFLLTLCFPLVGGFLDKDIVLSGVTESSEKVSPTIETFNDGTYQNYVSERWENGFPGRKTLLRIRNQFLYFFAKDSPNNNVVIGKEGYLYEPNYILFETQAYAPSDEEYFLELGSNLLALKKLLSENNKELYVFITPSKADFYREYIPDRYMFLDNEEVYSYTNYSKLLEVLNQNKICYFDSIKYIEDNNEKFQSPVFYKSGIHWSHVWGASAAAELLSYINSEGQYHLSTVEVTEALSDIPIAPDTDLYLSLNLLTSADEQWYRDDVHVIEEGLDHPNVFCRGGSFMGQSLSEIIRAGVFGQDVHFENNNVFSNHYSDLVSLTSSNAYDEIDLDSLLGQSDILILEVNECAINRMSFGFIEYLLEHPDYLDRNY